LRDRPLGIAELLPDKDDGECQQDRVKHADGGEFKPGNLVVGRQLLKRDAAANQGGAEHGEHGR